ncbi:MAG: hypothetical protein AAF490_22870 [Chloroflexota bacterium]
MKKFISILILLLIISACGGTTDAEPSADENEVVEETGGIKPDPLTVVEDDEGEETEAEEPAAEADELPRATITPPPIEEPEVSSSDADGYPPPPEPTAFPEGYQSLEIAPQRDPYPAPIIELLPQPDVEFATLDANVETAWVVISSGIQCDTDAPSYNDILEAIDVLAEEDIAVYDGVTESRAVCAACGCPASTFYRLNIATDMVETAVSLGFAEETVQLDEAAPSDD